MEQTTQERFLTAIKDARGKGAKVRQNVQKCCRSCITPEDLGLAKGFETPLAYTFGGQGNAIYWDAQGNPVIRTGSYTGWSRRRTFITKPEDSAYFNHDNGGGAIIADAMRAQGFEVEWDGTEAQCVIVKFPSIEKAA